MVRSTVKTVSYTSGSRKYIASRKAVARAAALLRGRVARIPRAPLRTGGFYGQYNRRGREELKVINVDNITAAIPNTGTLVLLNGVAAGSDYTQRVGRKICLKSLLLRCFLYPSSTVSAPIGDIVRILVIYDAQANGAAPSVADILENGSYDGPMTLNNRDRFKVLSDKYYTMNANTYTAGAPTAGSPVTRIHKIFKKMSMDTIFNGTGNTVGAIQSGSLYMLYIGANNNASQLDCYSRVRFTDS